MRGRLALVCAAVAAMVATAFLVPLAILVSDFARDRAFSAAQVEAAAIEPVLALNQNPATLRDSVKNTSAAAADQIAIYVAESSGAGQVLYGRPRATTAAIESAAVEIQPVSEPVPGGYVVLQPVALNHRTAIIEVFLPSAVVAHGVASSWVAMSGVAICLIAASVFVGDRLGVRITAPARELGTAADAMAAGDLSVRSAVTGPPEIRSAAVVLNALAERLDQLLGPGYQPIAKAPGPPPDPASPASAEPADREPAETAPQAPQASAGLASSEPEPEPEQPAADAGTGPVPEQTESVAEEARCDAARVLTERLASWSGRADREHRPRSLAGAGSPVWVPVTHTGLTAAADALLGNIFQHTAAGTRFVVALHAGDGGAVITFADAGPGIDDPKRVLEPGDRRSGLQIAREVAESTGGELRVDRAPLGGTRVQMWLVTGTRPEPRR